MGLYITTLLSSLVLTLCASSVVSQELEAVLARAKLSSPRNQVSAVYDNDDSIYMFGGSYDTETAPIVRFSDILKYSISADTISRVGSLPKATSSGSTVFTESGQILYIGGFFNLTTVTLFDPTSESASNVGDLPEGAPSSGVVKVDSNSAYVLGTDRGVNNNRGIVKLDLDTMNSEKVGEFQDGGIGGFPLIGAVYDDKEHLHVFGYPSCCSIVLTINTNTLEQRVTELNEFFTRADPQSVVWDGQYAYFVGGSATQIGKYDSLTQQITKLTVQNYPGGGRETIANAAVYVKKLDRIYIFGGKYVNPWPQFESYTDEIHYIDLGRTGLKN